MNASWIPPAAKANPDEYERRLRAGGARQASAEDALLVELARKLAPVRSSPHAQAVSAPGRTDAEPMQPPEAATLQPSTAFAPDEPGGTAFVDAEAPHASGFGVPYLHDPNDAGPATRRRSGGWMLRAAALAPAAGAALLGAGLVIAVFGPKGGSPELPKAPPFIAAGQGPTKAPEPSGETVAIRSDPDVTPLKHTTPVKVVSSEKRPIDADASPGATPPSPTLPPAPAGAAQPTAGTSAGPPLAAPVAAAPIAVPPPAASQFPDSNPVRMASAPPAAGAPIAAPPPTASQFPDSGPVRTASGAGRSGALRHGCGRSGAPERCAAAARQTRVDGRKQGRCGCPADDAQARGAREAFEENFRSCHGRQDRGGRARRRGGDAEPAASPGASMTQRAPAEPQAAPPAPAAAQEPVNP